MNLASLWKLPIIYACENNLYNEYTHFSETTAGGILARPAAFGIPAEDCDGQDVLVVHAAASRAGARARRGEGPTFLLLNTYRYRGHHVGDINRTYYRSKDEEHQWMTVRDPIEKFTQWLISQGAATPETLEAVKAREQAAIDRALQFALDAPYPDPRDVGLHIYA